MAERERDVHQFTRYVRQKRAVLPLNYNGFSVKYDWKQTNFLQQDKRVFFFKSWFFIIFNNSNQNVQRKQGQGKCSENLIVYVTLVSIWHRNTGFKNVFLDNYPAIHLSGQPFPVWTLFGSLLFRLTGDQMIPKEPADCWTLVIPAWSGAQISRPTRQDHWNRFHSQTSQVQSQRGLHNSSDFPLGSDREHPMRVSCSLASLSLSRLPNNRWIDRRREREGERESERNVA